MLRNINLENEDLVNMFMENYLENCNNVNEDLFNIEVIDNMILYYNDEYNMKLEDEDIINELSNVYNIKIDLIKLNSYKKFLNK